MTAGPRISELSTLEDSSFVETASEPFSNILDLLDAVKGWTREVQNVRAISGTLVEASSNLELTPKADPARGHYAMVPHHHATGVLLIGSEERAGATVVCERTQLRGVGQNLDYEQVASLQERAFGWENTYSMAWTLPLDLGNGKVCVPFLYVFPNVDHFRGIENEEQYQEPSTLRGWIIDRHGNRRY